MTRARRVVDDAVGVRVLAREQAGTARRAEGRGGEGIQEARALARDTIHVRRLDERMTRRADFVPAHVVDDHEHDVGRSSRLRVGSIRRAEQGSQRKRAQPQSSRALMGHDDRIMLSNVILSHSC